MSSARPVVVLHSRLRPGQEAAYDAEHARVPGDLLAALRAGGVRDWVIWREGHALLHVVDVDDYAALEHHLAGEEANDRWQRAMAVHVAGFDDLDGCPLPAPRSPRLVWSMAEQVAATADSTETRGRR